MPILSKPYETHEKAGIVQAYDLGTAAVYKGALVGVNAAGKAVPLSPTASMKFLGVSAETAKPAEGATRVNVSKMGSHIFGASGFVPAPADLGKVVYAVTDWQVQLGTTGLTNATAVGTIVQIEKTTGGQDGVRVRTDLHTV